MKSKYIYDAGDSFLTRRPDSFYKGKSFNYSGEWTSGNRYFSDEFMMDYVSYQNCFLACKKTHVAALGSGVGGNEPVIEYDENNLPVGVQGDYWIFVMRGGTNSTAYDIAVEHGYEGTEEEWIKTLQKHVVTGAELKDSIKCAPDLDLENVVRFDVDQTAKSALEKDQARKNINAASEDDLLIAEEPSEDYYQANRTLDQIALVWEPQELTPSELAQAQENLHIADESRVSVIEKKIAELDEKGLTTLGNINDLVNPTYDGHTADVPGTVPAFFVDAINNYVGLVGDPVKDNVKKAGLAVVAGFTDDMVGTLNYLYNLTGVKIVDVTPPGDTSGCTWYALCDKSGARIPDSEVFMIPRDNEIHDARIIEGGLDNTDPDNPKFIEGGTGHYWLRFLSGFFDVPTSKWIDTPPIYCLIDKLIYIGKTEEKPYNPDGSANPLYGGATVQVTIADNAVTGFREVSADIMEDTVDRKHLNKDGKTNYDFTGYDFTLDPTATADYYIRCASDYPGAIRLTPAAIIANPDITAKLVPAYKTGELYYTWVRHITAAKELDTEATTLREAVNELVARYPVSVKMYENGVTDPVDGKTATTGSKYTYVVKQRVDGSDLKDIATLEVPLAYKVLRLDHILAVGDEWLGNLTDDDAYKAAHPELKAVAGESLLDIYVTNETKIEDPTDPTQLIDKIEHIYCRIGVKDEVTGNTIKMMDPADPTQLKEYADPAAVFADFENVHQIQLFVAGDKKELSAKLLFEDDKLPGSEIIPD